MAKIYSNEPKINHHLACKTYIMAMYAFKNTPHGLKNDSGVHKCCANPV